MKTSNISTTEWRVSGVGEETGVEISLWMNNVTDEQKWQIEEAGKNFFNLVREIMGAKGSDSSQIRFDGREVARSVLKATRGNGVDIQEQS